ncbi:MAG: MBL fold metallo-hydrolase [Chloroflexota bacterium]
MTTESFEAQEIAPDLWQLPLPIHRHSLGGANGYLIRDADGFLLFDCGADVEECVESLAFQLSSLGVPFDAIHTVILSHGHGDHAGQAHRVAARAGARIACHQHETRFIGYPNGSDADRQQFVAWLRRQGYPEPEIEAVMQTAATNERGDRRDQFLEPELSLAGGEVFKAGRYNFEALWIPGHTPGHLCLYDRDQRVLLTGDHILEIVTPNVGLHPLLAENPLPGYLASLRRLADADIQVTLPGHGARIMDLPARTAEIADRHDDRRQQLLSLMSSTPRSAYEFATLVWAKPGRRNWSAMHPHLRRNAVGMLAAHLELLAEGGENVTSQEEAGVLHYRQKR